MPIPWYLVDFGAHLVKSGWSRGSLRWKRMEPLLDNSPAEPTFTYSLYVQS